MSGTSSKEPRRKAVTRISWLLLSPTFPSWPQPCPPSSVVSSDCSFLLTSSPLQLLSVLLGLLLSTPSCGQAAGVGPMLTCSESLLSTPSPAWSGSQVSAEQTRIPSRERAKVVSRVECLCNVVERERKGRLRREEMVQSQAACGAGGEQGTPPRAGSLLQEGIRGRTSGSLLYRKSERPLLGGNMFIQSWS